MNAGEEETSQELVIIRRRSGGGEEGKHGGVWKIAYADFMTAMMAFFLVMWLINSTDKKTITQIATYFNPMRLTDKVTNPKGLQDMESGAQGKDDKFANSTHSGGKDTEDTRTKEAERPTVDSQGRPVKPPHTEEALFSDPYGILAELALRARAQPKPTAGNRPGDGTQTPGDAFRDPFDPAFKRPLTQENPVEDPTSSRINFGAAALVAAAAEANAVKSEKSGRAKEAVTAPVEGEKKGVGGEKAAKDPAQGAEEAERAKLEAEIKKLLAEAGGIAGPQIEVAANEEGLLVSLTDRNNFGMFAIGSAEPKPDMVVLMERLAKLLVSRPGMIVVRGHTDARQYRSGTYDNWRLSTARAHMAYYMLVRGGIEEKRFERVEGHADRSLKVLNDPGAAQNRRIEILLRKAKS